MKRIFVGRNGIRAGWAVLLFVAIFVGVEFALLALLHHLNFNATPPSRSHVVPASYILVMECVQLCGVFVSTTLLAAIERKSPFAYGLRDNARMVRFGGGIIIGFAAISVLVLLLRQGGFIRFDPTVNHGADVLKYGVIWAIAFIMTGVFEESLFRGYLQHTLARGVGFWWGALLTSLLFGAMHGINHGETPVGLFMAVFFGLVSCMSLWYTGSLWWIIGVHAGWDWGESFFYGTSDSGTLVQGSLLTAHPVGNVFFSGGATGPEGSLLVFPILLALAVLMRAKWRRAGLQTFAMRKWRSM